MARKIKFGVLGYASIARRELIPALVDAANAEPYALASQNAERRAEAARDFPFEKIYDSYEALLEDREVEAVYIPLPNHLHKVWAIKAMEKGKHVLCEKPMALTRADCLEMMASAQKNKVWLMEAFMYRFTTRTQILKDTLASGLIGEVRHINSTFRFLNTKTEDTRFNPAMGGGALWDVGCYPVNLVGMVMGEAPVSIKALKTMKYGVDFSLTAVLRYQNGAICTVSGGFDSDSALMTEINGTLGSLLIPDTFHETGLPILHFRDSVIIEIPVPACDRYVLEVEDFCGAILDKRPPAFSLEETLRNIGLIEDILKAAE